MKYVIVIILLFSLASPVSALEITPPEVPSDVQELMPQKPESFGQGLWYMLQEAANLIEPALVDAALVCSGLIAVSTLVSLLSSMPGSTKNVVELSGTICVGLLLLKSSNSLIHLGTQTVAKLSDYGKLLLPVLAAALAAQGGTTTSAAIYAGTAIFDAILGSAISKLLCPMIYIYICLSVANSALGSDPLGKIRDLMKWIMTWGLKIILYFFTGYIGITGVVSGSADAAAIKAAKLTISGMVPVVGGILSDASEAVLVGAGVVKNGAGIYGMIAILAIVMGPFLQIGIQYLLLKATAAVCGLFGTKSIISLVQDFTSAMGLLLAMTGSSCLLLLISAVCFMKGVG
jgi:stage III sporulation protein AE